MTNPEIDEDAADWDARVQAMQVAVERTARLDALAWDVSAAAAGNPVAQRSIRLRGLVRRARARQRKESDDAM